MKLERFGEGVRLGPIPEPTLRSGFKKTQPVALAPAFAHVVFCGVCDDVDDAKEHLLWLTGTQSTGSYGKDWPGERVKKNGDD